METTTQEIGSQTKPLIWQKLDMIEESLKSLQEETYNLKDKLEPILKIESPKEAGSEAKVPSPTNVASRLQDIKDRIGYSAIYLRKLKNRLQI